MTRFRTALCVLLLVLVAGCGGSDDESAGERTTAQTSDPTPEVTLVEACPMVEAELIDDMSDDQARQYLWAWMADLSDRSDLETQNALEGLIAALNDYPSESLQKTIEDPYEKATAILDARAAIRDSIGSLADRCKVAGSSALQ